VKPAGHGAGLTLNCLQIILIFRQSGVWPRPCHPDALQPGTPRNPVPASTGCLISLLCQWRIGNAVGFDLTENHFDAVKFLLLFSRIKGYLIIIKILRYAVGCLVI
jgi:hypothetical protein